MSRFLKRYIHEEGMFKIAVIDSTGIGQDMYRTVQPPPVGLQLVTQAMTGALLLSSNLKNDGVLSFRFGGDGPMSSITVEADTLGRTRGTAGNIDVVDVDPNALFASAIGAGQLSVKRKMEPSGKIFSSVVDLIPGEIALNFANYLLQSEQVSSAIQLGVRLDEKVGVKGAGGVLIQAMPGANENVLFILEQRLQEMASLGDLFAEKDGHEKVVAWLADDMKVRELKQSEVRYHCGCNRQRMLQILATLPMNDLQDLGKEKDGLKLNCSFCGKQYQVMQEDLNVIIEMKQNPA